MATDVDLKTIEALCEGGADAAMDLLIKLGPRPSDPTKATTWDTQDALLKNKISTLSNLASSIGALLVVQTLQDVWPQMETLAHVTTSAEAKITKIAEINKALGAIASIVNFATAAITVATQPTPGNAGNLNTAFKNVQSALA